MNKVSESSSYIGGCFSNEQELVIINTDKQIRIFDISTSSFLNDDVGFPPEASTQCWVNNMVVGKYTDPTLQGDVWFCTLNKERRVEHYQQKKLHSKGISCILFSQSIMKLGTQSRVQSF